MNENEQALQVIASQLNKMVLYAYATGSPKEEVIEFYGTLLGWPAFFIEAMVKQMEDETAAESMTINQAIIDNPRP